MKHKEYENLLNYTITPGNMDDRKLIECICQTCMLQYRVALKHQLSACKR